MRALGHHFPVEELLVRGATLVSPDWPAPKKADLLVQAGKIAEIGERVSSRGKVLDASDLFLCPGFIDLHCHGGGDGLFGADPESSRKAILHHLRHGTTGIVASLMPAPLEELRSSLATLANLGSPVLLGAALEGPFVSPARAGALPREFFLLPDVETFRSLVGGFERFVRIVALAPELPGAFPLLFEILRLGAIPALGHTDADYFTARKAVEAGALLFLHLFNAMRPFRHREPGAVGAALDTDAFVEVIVDGYHLHPAAVRLALRAKGLDRICLVTDAVPGEGPEPARLPDGTLAGSRLTMNQAVQNFMAFTGCSLSEALRAATLNPAQVLGLAHRKGTLAPGKDADLILFDEDWQIHGAIVEGEILWLSDPGRYR